MNTHAEKTSQNISHTAGNRKSRETGSGTTSIQFSDNRPETVVQRKLNEMANNHAKNNSPGTFGKMAPTPSSAVPVQLMKKTTPAPGKYLKQPGESDLEFKTRMQAEMKSARQSATKDDYSQLPESYLTKKRSEREKELDNFRSGNLPNGQEIEADKTPGGTTITKTNLAHQSIRKGAVSGSTDFNGGQGLAKGGTDLKVKTLSGGNIGAFEGGLQNPYTLQPHDTGGHAQRPREGLATRQQSVMATAKKADRFMRTLDAGGDLSATHAKAKFQTTGSGNLKPGFNVVGTGVRANGSAEDIHGYGANEFGNKPDSRPGGMATPERLLPEITNHPGGTDPNGAQSRVGRWSEADVDPQVLGPHPSGNPAKYSYGPRNSERLLHTASGTQVKQPDGSSAPVDFRYQVTSDHYESAVPVAPLATDYKNIHPYQSPYMDPDGKKSSLQKHQEAENERIRSGAHADAQVSSAVREAQMAAILSGENRQQSEKTRTDELEKLDTSLRAKAQADATASSLKREQAEEQRFGESQRPTQPAPQASPRQTLRQEANRKKQQAKANRRAQKSQNRARQQQLKWQSKK